MTKTSFSENYRAETPTASMRKLGPVAWAAQRAGYAELIDPGSLDPEILRRLHAPAFVDSFLSGEGQLARSQGWPWTPGIRDGVLAIQAGQLLAARHALAEGVAANVAQGFHHSRYERGAAYCTFNGLALVAQEFPKLTVAVLDCDEHGGDGTACFTERLPNLRHFSICGQDFGGPRGDRSVCRRLPAVTRQFSLYTTALTEAFVTLERWKPDLIIYQAGADPHIDDPLGSLGLTTGQLWERDVQVFEFCRAKGLPVFFVLAGGYQEPIETRLVPLHLNTFKAAFEVFRD